MQQPSFSELTPDQWTLAHELLRLFKIDGQRADLVAAPGQIELFGRIVFKVANRQYISTNTQYGKSLFIALACIILTALGDETGRGEDVKVLAPTDEKSMIIMRYYLQHLGDSPGLFSQLLSADNKVERLQQSATKDTIILKNGGKMQALTANAGNSQKGFEAAMGEGGDVIILDEAGLIPDVIEATVYRMIIGRGGRGMYVKVGNPFYRGTHFQRSSRDPNYLKLIIDHTVSLREGRISRTDLEEARTKPFFEILYECKFPSEKQVDTKGYTALYKEAQLDIAYLDQPLPLIGEKHLGIDVSHGGANFSTIVLRGSNQARLMFKEHTEDELILLTQVETIAKANGIPLSSRYIHFDIIGSAALCARANELWPYHPITQETNRFGVNVGEACDPERLPDGEPMVDERTGKPVRLFLNKRAQLAWRAQEWVQRGGKLFPKPEFDDLLGLRYKVQSDKKIKLKSKEEMADDGLMSPDVADGLNLTFDVRPRTQNTYQKPQPQEESMSSFGV